MSETVEVKGESPVIQATTRRTLVHRHHRVGREPPDRQPQLHGARLARAGRQRQQPPGGGGANNVMMDGVSTMDTGSNSVLLQMNVESIARSQSAGVELSGRVRPLERSADYGGDQERNESLPRLAVRRRAQLRLELESTRPNKLNGDPKRRCRSSATIGYSIGGPIGKPGGSNKLFFFYSQEYRAANGRQRHAAIPLPDRAGAPGRFLADHRQQRQSRFPTFAIRGRPATVRRRTRTTGRRALPTAASSARFPRTGSTRPGLNILNMYPMPNITNVPAGQNYNYEIVRPNQSLLAWQPAIRWTTTWRRRCAPRSSTRGGRSGKRPSTDRCRGSTTP